ncbi:MAG: HGGxSTG domain-containing protein, partial [Hyphomicrobiaceae bacterium]
TRRVTACQSPAVGGKARCRMHGGAFGSGAKSSEANHRYRHGCRAQKANAERAELMRSLRAMKAIAKTLADDCD